MRIYIKTGRIQNTGLNVEALLDFSVGTNDYMKKSHQVNTKGSRQVKTMPNPLDEQSVQLLTDGHMSL